MLDTEVDTIITNLQNDDSDFASTDDYDKWNFDASGIDHLQ